MARVLNGSSQYLSVANTLLSNEPIGMFAWGKSGDITAGQTIISLGDGGAASGRYTLNFNGDVASDPVRAIKDNDAGTGAVVAATSTGFSSGVWAAAGASFRSDTSRDAYIDGGSKGSNATSRTDPTPNFMAIGARVTSTVTSFFNGSIAEAFLFDTDPTDAQHATMAKGIHPIDAGIPIVNIRAWYPLLSNDANSVANGYPDLTPTASPTLGSHPSQPIYPRIGAMVSW